ncbi:hypothetical protein J5751_04810 [bacterium]|nr:hypothetical protein [bacterium]
MENLRPLTHRTKEEQREIAIKGGKASGVARREKKRFKELLEMALSMKDEKGEQYDFKIVKSMIKKATSGSERAFELIRDTIGEKPIEKTATAEVPYKEFLKKIK